jgi:hypothetical protein
MCPRDAEAPYELDIEQYSTLARVGTSGRSGERFSEVIASAFTWPHRRTTNTFLAVYGAELCFLIQIKLMREKRVENDTKATEKTS